MDHQEATAVLEKMAKKNLRDALYHVRKLAITHYFAEKGKRRNKDRVIAENLTIEDDAGWQSVSNFSLLSYVHHILHYIY
jgi:hypothetical protein